MTGLVRIADSLLFQFLDEAEARVDDYCSQARDQVVRFLPYGVREDGDGDEGDDSLFFPYCKLP